MGAFKTPGIRVKVPKAMQSVGAHAALLAAPFAGFDAGLCVMQRDDSKRIVLVATLFTRVIHEDSGLRFKVSLPMSILDSKVCGSRNPVNLLSDSEQEEIVVSQTHYHQPFTVQDLCAGMQFAADTVLPGVPCFIPSDCLLREMVGLYIMPYYVHELRIMYRTCGGMDIVYDRHTPIFENICGYVSTGKKLSERSEVICVHGNLVFRGCSAIFKGVRKVREIVGIIRSVLGEDHRTVVLETYVNMAVVTSCLGKSSLVSSNGSLLETSLLFTQGTECIGLVARTESEKNMVKIKVLDWTQLLQESILKVRLIASFHMKGFFPFGFRVRNSGVFVFIASFHMKGLFPFGFRVCS
jgi:hypothetical protein